MTNNENISFLLEPNNDGFNDVDSVINIDDYLQEINDEINDHDYNDDDDLVIPKIINYNENFTVKELLLICEYYGISKELKSNKCNKEVIINFLVDFESNCMNTQIVLKRQRLWFYINELKNDKFMKKYVLW
jgi:hypothetical protein